MKSVKTLSCLMAIAIASTVGMTSCEKKTENGTDDVQKKGVVKTEFSISLPKQLKNNARYMSGTTVQKNGLTDFQGITGITLIPFAKTTAIEGTDSRLASNITTLGDVSQSDIDRPSSAKVYNDVSIPLSTASFLFYAKSGATGTDFEVGALDAANLTNNNPADFTFSLKQIQADPSALTATSANGGKLMQYLTNIANASDGAKAWYQYTNSDDEFMTSMFNTYKTINGLSSFEVARVLTDLNKSLKPLRASNAMADAVATAIADATYATVNASDEVELISALNNFPQENRLPQGSVNIKWDASGHKFIAGDYSNMATLDKYVYPAQLWYYANSTIKASNTSKQSMYDNTNNWATVLDAHTDGTSVNSRTRAVAIVNPVQYAVARFDVQVRVKQTALEDNSLTVEGERTDIDCVDAGFPISAILVGGQQQVKYDFTTNGGTEYTIYDNVMASATMAAKAGTTYSDMNHTLVLENGTNDVMIAVEMTNNTGKDFYGAAGQLVPKNGKFYVVAKLTATDATETGGHVFKQDYTTTAQLTLKDLKTAYNTIPDLRTPELELGFSVDLTWETGHNYEVEFN